MIIILCHLKKSLTFLVGGTWKGGKVPCKICDYMGSLSLTYFFWLFISSLGIFSTLSSLTWISPGFFLESRRKTVLLESVWHGQQACTLASTALLSQVAWFFVLVDKERRGWSIFLQNGNFIIPGHANPYCEAKRVSVNLYIFLTTLFLLSGILTQDILLLKYILPPKDISLSYWRCILYYIALYITVNICHRQIFASGVCHIYWSRYLPPLFAAAICTRCKAFCFILNFSMTCTKLWGNFIPPLSSFHYNWGEFSILLGQL